MTAKSEGRIRFTVLGGYLGSGKTTWLRHQLHEGHFRNAHVIVNEAAETPVDDALLGQSARLTVLAGGCVCCTAKADLLALLRRLCDERSGIGAGEGPRLEQIVLETSGLADPGPIVEAIRSDPQLVYHFVVSEVVVVVDALHCLSQLRSEPLGRRQIEIADRLIVTKVDIAEQKTLCRLLATLRTINPTAALAGAVQGVAAELPDFVGTPPESLPDLSGLPAREPITPTRLYIDETIDWTAFTVWLSALLHARGDDIVRVKGVVRTPAGRLLLQTVRKIVQSPEILPEQGDTREDNMIVVIGRGYTSDQLRRSLKYFAGLKG
ncbi:MAG: GTP-binding protein [Alphaproteobacteria bacterium]|nr:GTP-binding protein [Alphaproteobacteria bacterium]